MSRSRCDHRRRWPVIWGLSMRRKRLILAEVVTLVTAIIFVYELFFANRLLPEFNVSTASSDEVLSFYNKSNGGVAYVNFSFDQNDLPSVLNIEDPEIFFSRAMNDSLELTFIIPVDRLLSNPYSIINDYRAEDYSFHFEGPVHINAYEGEGMPYIRMDKAPITDSIERKTHCTRSVKDTSGASFIFSYIWYCIL